MDKVPVFGILCGGLFILFFTGIGIWLILRSISERKKVNESATWPSVTGVITENSIDENALSSDDDNIPSYSPNISYTYQVGGKNYESSRLMFGARQGGSYKSAAAVASRYPVGASTPVFYNSADPIEAVLERQSKSSSVALILGIVFLTLSLCTLCIITGSFASQYLK
jgi:hypothetical protein